MESLSTGWNQKSSGKADFNFINEEEDPNKSKPHYSAIMINDPNVRVGLKNTLEMSVCLNSISNLEFSRAYPYFNAVFILPNKVNTSQGKRFNTASMNQFLFGGSLTGKDASFISSIFESKTIKRTAKYRKKGNGVEESESEFSGVEANMSLFTSPQTMINANEPQGHYESVKAIAGYDRVATPRDPMLPFMTLKSFDVDVAPTKGLMSYKTARMSMVLHDKNRMVDIAPLIKPDLFGAFGAEIIVEYGWAHPDANPKNKFVTNKIGEFIDSSRCLEK